jgi:hypothetical protein
MTVRIIKMAADTSFIDIKIVGLEVHKTASSALDERAHNLYFAISATPPPGWIDIFQEECTASQCPFGASIERDYLIVEAPLDQFEQQHLDGFKTVLRNTNEKFRERLKVVQEEVRQEQAAIEKQEQGVQRIQSLQSRLNFD